MSSEHERDQTTDALLRAALPRLPAQGPAACVDAGILAAWAERTLPRTDAERVEAHLAACPRCQQMLAAFARTEPEPAAAAAVPFWQRWPRRWLVPAGALAAAALALVVVTRESAPPAPAIQVARLEQPSQEPAADKSAPFAGARTQDTGLAAPGQTPKPRPDAQPPLEAVGLADQMTPAAPHESDRASAADARQQTATMRRTSPGVAGGLSAQPPPPAPAPVDVTPTAAPIEAPAAAKPATPEVTSESERLARAEADQSTTKLDSVQITNKPLNSYRNQQALVVLVPGEPAAAAKTAGGDAVIAEIISEPRPVFGRAGRGGARSVPARGPSAAAEAAQAASEDAKLPNTIPARWRILANGTVERSVNAGATWHPLALDSPVALTAGSSPSDDVAWFVGPGGVVLLSTDGARLQRLSFPNTSTLVEVTAVNDRAATVRTADGQRFVTGDGGRTWREQ